ncbi:hypothetical protein IAT38_004811 [Cryptococcus sp. DSM 104549]
MNAGEYSSTTRKFFWEARPISTGPSVSIIHHSPFSSPPPSPIALRLPTPSPLGSRFDWTMYDFVLGPPALPPALLNGVHRFVAHQPMWAETDEQVARWLEGIFYLHAGIDITELPTRGVDMRWADEPEDEDSAEERGELFGARRLWVSVFPLRAHHPQSWPDSLFERRWWIKYPVEAWRTASGREKDEDGVIRWMRDSVFPMASKPDALGKATCWVKVVRRRNQVLALTREKSELERHLDTQVIRVPSRGLGLSPDHPSFLVEGMKGMSLAPSASPGAKKRYSCSTSEDRAYKRTRIDADSPNLNNKQTHKPVFNSSSGDVGDDGGAARPPSAGNFCQYGVQQQISSSGSSSPRHRNPIGPANVIAEHDGREDQSYDAGDHARNGVNDGTDVADGGHQGEGDVYEELQETFEGDDVDGGDGDEEMEVDADDEEAWLNGERK